MDADEPDRARSISLAVTRPSSPTMSKNERIKAASQGLFFVAGPKGEVHAFGAEIDALSRGEAETLSNEAKELSKFFGIYKQQERGERGKKTDDYFFMVRIKAPAGGDFSAEQWAALDDAAEQFADGTLRITSRQGIQYHHVYGPKLAPLVRHLNRNYRDAATLGACGDVNRNVMCSPIDGLDPGAPTGGRELAHAIAEELAPRRAPTSRSSCPTTRAATSRRMNSDEPLYGAHYLPRKFKVGIAHPADNSVDVLTQDVGLRAGREKRARRWQRLGSLQRRRARHDAQQPAAPRRCSGSTSAGSAASRSSTPRARSRSSRRRTASGRIAGRRAGSTRSGGSASTP